MLMVISGSDVSRHAALMDRDAGERGLVKNPEALLALAQHVLGLAVECGGLFLKIDAFALAGQCAQFLDLRSGDPPGRP